MIIIHGVQKLLNTSRLKPALYISEASENQHLHSWYARLLATRNCRKINGDVCAPTVVDDLSL
jgi:hypothetical protein